MELMASSKAEDLAVEFYITLTTTPIIILNAYTMKKKNNLVNKEIKNRIFDG